MLTFFVDIRSDHIYIQIARPPMEREADPATRPAPSLGLRARRWAAGLRWKESFWDLNLEWTKSHWWQNLIFPRKLDHILPHSKDHSKDHSYLPRSDLCLFTLTRTFSGLYCLLLIAVYMAVTVNKLVSSPMHAPEMEVTRHKAEARVSWYFTRQVSALMLYLYLVSCVFMLYLLLYLTTRWVSRAEWPVAEWPKEAVCLWSIFLPKEVYFLPWKKYKLRKKLIFHSNH